MHLSGLWRVRADVRPYAGAMAAMVVAAFAGLFAATAMPLVTRAVIDGPVARGESDAVWPLALLALGLGVFEGGMAMLRRFVLANAATGMETDIRNDLYADLQRLPVAFHDKWQSGQLLSRAVSDPVVIRRFVGFGLVFLVVNIATFIAVIALLMRMHVALSLVVAASAVPVFWLSARFERNYGAVSRRLQDEEGDLTTLIEEGAGGVRVIKAFGRRQLALDKFAVSARVVYRSSMDKVYLRARFWSVLSLIPNLTLAVVLLGGALAVGNGSMRLGELAAFVSLTLMLVWPVESLGEILAMAEEAATAATRVFEVFDTEPDIVDKPDALVLDACTGRVRFEAVGFSYGEAAAAILHDIDLEIAPGETLALVGTTGSGKTTLASLVPRLYDVTTGRVTVDGHDVRDLTLKSLRRHVAVAFEDPVLFSASVRENLLLGFPEASDDDVARALEVAQAQFAYELPWGLDTRGGEQGLSLSGGQRQRLALARAVIGRPRVLVLDDPLSSLDVHTEALVEEALKRVLAGTTALLVVHRPSTVALADRVALLQDGTITAVGTHSELLETIPAYRDILSQKAEEISNRSQEVGVSTDTWRGVVAEGVDDVATPGLGTFLRSRSRRLLASLLRPHKRLIWLSLGVIVVFNLTSLAGPMLIGMAVDRGIPPLLEENGGGATALVVIVSVFVAASLLNAVCDYVFDRITGRVGQDILFDLRLRLYDHFQKLSISFHEHYTSGRVVSRLTSDIEAIAELLNYGLQTLAWSLLSVVSIIVLLALLDVPMSMIAWVAFGLVVIGTIWFRINSARAVSGNACEAVALVIVHFVESLAGIRAVQAFRREPRNQEIFEDVNGRYRDANRWAARLIGAYGPGTRIVGGIGSAAVLYVGAHRVIGGDIKVGVLIAFLLYLRRFFEPVQELAQFYNAFQSAAAALEKLSGVLDEPPAVAEPADPTPLLNAAGNVRFEGVSFHYREGTPVLPRMDLDIPAGQTVALVGETGAGKTTVARLIGRFYDPVEGSVRLDGINLRDITVDDLRRVVVTVTQENFLFSGSVADNIEFGRPGATRAQVVDVARAIGAHDFISALPDGYDTDVRKRGGRLSAGQRQLVSFARAFLADPHVLILDEATSSLDIPSERLVQHALRTLLADRTAVIIAHRLSTVEIADRVLVVDGGRIVEDGAPVDLIGGGGRYSALHQAWADSLV